MKSTNHSHRNGCVRNARVRSSLSSLSPFSSLISRRFSKTAVSLGLSLGLATAGLGAGVLAPSASAQIHEICTASEGWTPEHKITHGHQDMTVFSENGLEPALIDDSSGKPKSYKSRQSVVEVSNNQHVKLGALGIAGLADEGWYLPQTQEREVPWLGFSTMHLSSEYLAEGEEVSMNLNLQHGPGRMIGWLQEGLGGNKIVLDSANSNDAWPIPYNTHVHTGFVFEKAGVYEVGFEFGLPRGGTQTLEVMFLVGDYDCGDGDSTSTGTNSGSESKGDSGESKTFGQHLTEAEKEIAQTEKAISGIENSVRKLVSPITKKEEKSESKPNGSDKSEASSAPSAGHEPDSAKPRQASGGNGEKKKPMPAGGGNGEKKKSAPAGGGPKATPVTPKRGGGGGPVPAASGSRSSSGSSGVPAKAPTSAGGGSKAAAPAGSARVEAAPPAQADADNPGVVDGQEDVHGDAVDGDALDGGAEDGAAQRGAANANYKPTSSSMSFFSGLILGIGVFAFALGIGIYVVMWRRSRNK
ncbi:choice-of-anchor M domain-containing protein [Corynebacterium sp. MSK297]|uniref:choice-of-anchor M domain-containing protein n=1 Tax=Corynebacterium sp. MSK297 TaxID=3050221 RepID=UPI00254E44BF|nr:choice-of-anchor M domain-containing protein [Corynebacterium sp. MSK297]MDK8846159.1 choice-of-anchor M domain-containing protein [Corynebacterium sp. MSK297]